MVKIKYNQELWKLIQKYFNDYTENDFLNVVYDICEEQLPQSYDFFRDIIKKCDELKEDFKNDIAKRIHESEVLYDNDIITEHYTPKIKYLSLAYYELIEDCKKILYKFYDISFEE